DAEAEAAKDGNPFGIGKGWMGSKQEKTESKVQFNTLDSRSGFKPLPSLGVSSEASDVRTKRLQRKVDELQDELTSLKNKTRDYDRVKGQADRMTKINKSALDTINGLEK